MKNILKDPQEFKKLSTVEVIDVIKAQIQELKGVSERSVFNKDNFEKASWSHLQAYEIGFQKALNQLDEFTNIKHTENELELEIQSKKLDAPRLNPQSIDAVIESEDYYIFPNTTLTVCCLKLKNGFTVTGESAAASKDNFDVEIGRKIAKDNARSKIWALEGYLLRQSLYLNNKD